jgi:Zn ribbon nucleic-acid-binding protein
MARKFDANWQEILSGAPAPPPAAPVAGGGLECPKCGCRHFRTLHTWQRQAGFVLRRKACRHCGHRMTTRENAIGNAP